MAKELILPLLILVRFHNVVEENLHL